MTTDRDAQRAIRERQKAKCEEYERRIEELESQRPYQELQSALRLKETVEAENAEIRKTLTSVVAMIQPILGRTCGKRQSFLDPPTPESMSLP